MIYFLSPAGVVRAFSEDADAAYYDGMKPISESHALELVSLQEQEQPQAPQFCTPAQGLVALYALKAITEDSILASIESIPDDELRYTAKIGYQRATTWERTSPTMQTMAQLLQLSESDLDELFTHAAGVNL